MATETLSPLYEDENWDIAVACDINLSRCFRTLDGTPNNSFLDISSFAIASTLNGLGDETSSGSVIFTAVHEDSLNSERSKITHMQRRTVGNCITEDANHSRVNVMVAADVATKSSGYRPTLRECPKEDRQKTAIHELSHVIDSKDRLLQLSVIEHNDRYRLTRTALALVAINAGMLLAYESVGLLTENFYIKTGSMAMGSFIGLATYIKAIREKLDHNHYLSRPNEVRAREAEKSAGKHPPIISFITNRTERNTNIDYNLINDWA